MREKLSATFCEKKTEPGRYADGGNLYLYIKPNGKKSWGFRYRSPISGKLRDMGLGVFGRNDVTLAQARILAGEKRGLMRDRKDPLDEARKDMQQARANLRKRLTFGDCAERDIEAHKASWTNPKHAAQWVSTLKTYAQPIYDLAVTDIDSA